jgi:hypothetical protein
MNLLLALAMFAFGQPSGSSSFPLIDANGQPVESARLFGPDSRVIVYVVPGSEPATRLIDALRVWSQRDPLQWRERVHVIVAAPPAAAREWLGERWSEPGAMWFADPSGNGWRALGLQGTLGVVGISGSRLEWKIDGVIADPSVVEPAIDAWIKGGER